MQRSRSTLTRGGKRGRVKLRKLSERSKNSLKASRRAYPILSDQNRSGPVLNDAVISRMNDLEGQKKALTKAIGEKELEMGVRLTKDHTLTRGGKRGRVKL